MSFNENPDLAMTGASQVVDHPAEGEAPNATMQLLQRLAQNLQEYLPRTDEMGQQVSSLFAHQGAVEGDLTALRERTTGLMGAVNVLDDRTVHIATSLGDLSAATANSQEHIRELARLLTETQGGTNVAINNLISQVRTELTPLIQAMDAHPQVPATLKSEDTATTKEVPTPSSSGPSDPPKASVESGKATAEYTFHLRTRIKDCPKYNSDRTNNATFF
jgi:ABC-type transporter Mla subunit MlaD